MAAFANKALVSWDDAVAYIEHPSHTLGRQASPHSPPPQGHDAARQDHRHQDGREMEDADGDQVADADGDEGDLP
jgi:hypothetical protein